MGLGEISLGEISLGEMGLGEMGQNRSTWSAPKIFLGLLEILGFIVSCNFTFIHLSDCLYIAIVFKPIVNT